jgi:hypothetical protein
VATDYDTPRTNHDEEQTEQSLEALKARRNDPGADLGDEELAIRVVPKQADEFTCTRCFLVHHRSQLADEANRVCRDCAA